MTDSFVARHSIALTALKLVTGVFAVGLLWKAVPELRRYLQLRRM